MRVVVNKSFDSSFLSSKNEKQIKLAHDSRTSSYYGNVFECLQFNSANPPLADLFRQYHQLDGVWLVLSLIHWEATHNDVIVTQVEDALRIEENESKQLFSVVRNFLKNYSMEVYYHDKTTWLIRLEKDYPTIKSLSIDTIQNRSMMPLLEQLDPHLFWQKILTELQMVLNAYSNSALNSNLTPNLHLDTSIVNGVWIWGEGTFKFSLNQHISIITDDEILLKVCGSSSKEYNHSQENDNVKLFNKVSALNEGAILQKNDMIFIKYPEQIDLKDLEEKTKKNTTRWYWNNINYTIPAKGWRRLWR